MILQILTVVERFHLFKETLAKKTETDRLAMFFFTIPIGSMYVWYEIYLDSLINIKQAVPVEVKMNPMKHITVTLAGA